MLRILRLLATSLLFALVLPSAARAQYASSAGFAPGDRVDAARLASIGGPAGQQLSPLVGVRPVLVVYWRPGDPMSERALVTAARAGREIAKGTVVFPVAFIAAGQSVTRLRQRLAELGVEDLPPHVDQGRLAIAFGVRRVPTFALIDVTGVLRAVGGSDLGQQTGKGVSLLEAMARAGRGEAVPTLGVLAARPTYQLLGRKLPSLVVTESDGKTYRKVGDFVEPGKKTVLFYWSPSCPHCREALPKLRAWYESGRRDDLTLIDIARADSESLRRDIPALIADAPWVHLLDVDHSVSRKLLITETPTSFLLDGEGEVLSVQVGGDVDWNAWIGRPDAEANAASR